ncbi:unnamed protein product [Schistocephalus solidus]|uniref:Transposon Ty3-I Gag-Pol polyprotein n=1 Tax=Schistocephalus solidus TaxID=70667 RepID=A0A3P7CUN7_SCHSO|nr:unnamed protein product [Schistocephalus solidus]
MFGVATVQSHSSHDAATQRPWQPCSCGSSPRRNNWRRPQTQRINKPQARRSVDAIDTAPGPSDGEYNLVSDTVISCLGSTNCPLVQGSVGSTTLSCLVDSGAGCSLLHQQPFLEFQTKIRYCDRPSITLHTANGANLRHTGLVEFSLDLAGVSFTHQFIVSPDITWDCIIGVDFLNKFKCSLDFGRRLLHTASVKVPFLSRIPRPAKLPVFTVAFNAKELIPAHLDQSCAKKLGDLVEEFKDIFDWDGRSTGKMNVTEHCIDTEDARPIRAPPRRLPIFYQNELDTLISDMLNRNIIRPSHSPWSSPIVLVRKKDGLIRLCIGYRKLNSVTKKDSFPLPRIDATLDNLASNIIFSTLDLASGYWQV